MPLQRRIPKGGFTPLNRVPYQVINVRDPPGEWRSPRSPLRSCVPWASSVRSEPLKILGTGELSRAVQVHAHAFSASAREKIEAAGGSATEIGSDTDA
jgi:large subunit ribosomal protein L15